MTWDADEGEGDGEGDLEREGEGGGYRPVEGLRESRGLEKTERKSRRRERRREGAMLGGMYLDKLIFRSYSIDSIDVDKKGKKENAHSRGLARIL